MAQASRAVGVRLDHKHLVILDALQAASGSRSRNQVILKLIENARLVKPIVKHDVGTTIEAQHAQ